MEPVRILQVVPNMQQGGIENFIMNIYRNIDRDKVQFDFLVHYKREFFFDKEIESLGGRIYHFPVMENKKILKYILDLNIFFKQHPEYKVVHAHMASLAFFYLGIARYNGVKTRILHSHGTSFLKSIKGYIKYILFKLAKYNANHYFACSTEAGKYLFKNRNFEIVPNAINFEKFKFNNSIRNKIRSEMKLENEFVIGHVGRFNLQKNHEQLIKIFNRFIQKYQKSKLILIGTGELETKIKNMVNDLKISDKVLFLGIRSDVDEIYQAMDCFVLPSLFEGLPVSGIEAQASDLPCIFSSTITKEVKINKNTFFINNENIEQWVKTLEKIKDELTNKRKSYEIKENFYDIKIVSKKMQKFYLDANK